MVTHQTLMERTDVMDVARNADNNTNNSHLKPKPVEISIFEDKFQKIINDSDYEAFEDLMSEFSNYMHNAVDLLPGPKHPAVRFYKARKKGQTPFRTAYSATNNPQRLTTRKREDNRKKYQYELAQYYYYNRRRKIIRHIFKSQPEVRCKIPFQQISEHFQHLFGNENNNSSARPKEPVCSVDDISITEEEITYALSRIKVDTSPGPDHIIVRPFIALKAARVLALITNAMLKFGKCPQSLKKARTILIFKGGNPDDISNWRPITIFSIIRRIIEKVLDRHLRYFLGLSPNQRGFVSLPGTHINTSLVNACLQTAKHKKKTAALFS